MSKQGRYHRIVEPRHCGTLCRERGCRETELTFRFEYADGSDAGWLCPQHAARAGFCPHCGNFIAGSDEGENEDGLCQDCLDEFRAFCGAGGDEEEE